MADDHGAGPRWLRLVARITPSERRRDWLREWSVEQEHHAAARGAGYRLRRALDAVEDALRLRYRRGARLHASAAIGSALGDLRQGTRAIVRRPGYALGAVLALALGIGANTAIFSVFSGVLLHSLPYDAPERLVMLWGDASSRGSGVRINLPPADFLDYRRDAESLSAVVAARNGSLALTEQDEPLVPLTHFVTHDFFDVLGVEPALGREFDADDVAEGRVVMLSHGLWQSALAGDPAVVGTDLILDDEPYRVVGVLPADYWITHRFPVQPDLFVPLDLTGQEHVRARRQLMVYGRLAPGATVKQARQEVQAIGARIAAANPDTHADWGMQLIPIRDNAVGQLRPVFRLVLAAVGLLLLVACANVANLGLAQATERSREVLLRLALGASRGRIARQLLAEGILLATLGGGLGLALAWWGLPPLVQLIPTGAQIPFVDQVTIDGRALAFTAAVSLFTGLLVGLAPARHGRRQDVASGLREDGRTTSGSRGAARLRAGLVVAETALAVVLLIAAGLLVQSLQRLQSSDLGFEPENLLTIRNSLRGDEFRDPDTWREWYRQSQRTLEGLPSVESASAVIFAPPVVANTSGWFRRAEDPEDPSRNPTAVFRTVLPRYFETMGISLLAGRDFDGRDDGDSRSVVIVNETLARTHFPDRDPVGATIVLEKGGRPVIGAPEEETPRLIVGVVGDVAAAGTDPAPAAMIYQPHAQVPGPIMSWVLRTREAPLTAAAAARQALWERSRSINLYGTDSFARLVADQRWQSRFTTQLLGLFAALALALGATGIYAVLSYSVARRRQEIGVRMALGAGRGKVVGLVLSEGLRLVAVGIALGAAASWLGIRLVEHLLLGVRPGDPLTLAAVTVLLLGVASVAALVPALRAVRVEPAVALQPD